MLKVGVTGGIGSGKSMVCEVFRHLGVPVYNSDLEARNIVDTNETVREAIKATFGDHLYRSNELDRKALGGIVFNNQEKLATLNEIVHPVVGQHFQMWMESQAADIIIKEAAILIETGIYKELDYTILVTAPTELRIARVMKRDQVSREEVEERISKQWTDEQKTEYVAAVITNDNITMLLPQVLATFEQLKQRI
jgi:dephospho-CoA kinase